LHGQCGCASRAVVQTPLSADSGERIRIDCPRLG
jgi:hypothetical protein